MADIASDGMTKVVLMTAVANIASPTVAELNAGVPLSPTMMSDGMAGFQPDTADVDTSKFNSTFNTTKPGRISYSGTMLRFAKQDAVDTIYNSMAYGSVLYVGIRRSVLETTAWASTQKVEIYPVTCGERRRMDPEPNTLERWESPLKIHSQPNLNATVA